MNQIKKKNAGSLRSLTSIGTAILSSTATASSKALLYAANRSMKSMMQLIYTRFRSPMSGNIVSHKKNDS